MKNYNLQNLNILVLEQHKFMSRLLMDVLKQMGVRKVDVCHDIDQAFKFFNEIDPDLILTDWSPGADGLRFLGLVRRNSNSNNPYVPVIVVSAHTDLGRIYMARDAGMTEFLAKPLTAKLLYSRISSVIANYRVFVRNAEFFGPDRRRRRLGAKSGERRDVRNSQEEDIQVSRASLCVDERSQERHALP